LAIVKSAYNQLFIFEGTLMIDNIPLTVVHYAYIIDLKVTISGLEFDGECADKTGLLVIYATCQCNGVADKCAIDK